MMEKWSEKPLDFSEVLEVTFSIIKRHFLKLFMITILLTGPINLFHWLVLLSLPAQDFESILERVVTAVMEGDWNNLDITPITLLIGSEFLLSMTFLLLARASMILAVDNIRRGEPFNVWSIVKQAFSRYWALLVGTSVYYLLMLILLSGTGLAVGSYFWTTGEEIDLLMALVFALIALGYLCGVIYLLTRWSFYFAMIIFENVSPGLKKSWQLTRGLFGAPSVFISFL
jgi:hypothetical protein